MAFFSNYTRPHSQIPCQASYSYSMPDLVLILHAGPCSHTPCQASYSYSMPDLVLRLHARPHTPCQSQAIAFSCYKLLKDQLFCICNSMVLSAIWD